MHVSPDAKRIGGWLKAARERQGRYSQEQAAPAVGTTTRTMGGWERGETMPPADKFLALVLLYGADLSTLLQPRYKTDLEGGAVVSAPRPSAADLKPRKRA